MKLENARYLLECCREAAEITRLFDKETGIEYIWSGDPAYWSGRNPILFPVIGSSYNKLYWFDGKSYSMGNHGFARHSEFELVRQSENEIMLKLVSNDMTRSQYPFDFSLAVNYRLDNDTVIITYRIRNMSDKTMPFAFGLHPAFNCPLTKDKKFEDYYLEFASPTCLSGVGPQEKGVLVKTMPLDYPLFEEYHTLEFDDMTSPYLTLTDGTHGVSVSTVGYNKVAVWSPQAPFICLEPWHSSRNKTDQDLPFEQRDAVFMLDPGQTYVTSYTIRVF